MIDLSKLPCRLDLLSYLEQVENVSFKTPLIALYEQTKQHLEYWPAAIKYHHSHVGGYADHVAQVIAFGIHLYETLNPIASFPFSKDDVIVSCFGHDLDKLWRYKNCEEEWKIRKLGQRWDYKDRDVPYRNESKAIAALFRAGIPLTDLQIEGIDHAEGGWSADLSSVYNRHGSISHLATIVHCADILSGFIFAKVIPDRVKGSEPPK